MGILSIITKNNIKRLVRFGANESRLVTPSDSLPVRAYPLKS